MRIWGLVALLMLAGLATGQVQTGHVVLDEPSLVGEPPMWVENSAGSSSVQVIVRNTGSGTSSPYTVHFEWVKDGAVRPLNEDEAKSFDAGQLGPGASFHHVMPWRLQPGEVGLGTIRVRLESVSGSTSRALDVFVPRHALSTGLGPTSGDATSGGVAFWHLHVYNDGNVPETAQVSILTEPPGTNLRALPQVRDAATYPTAWQQPARLNLGPGEVGSVRIRAHVSSGQGTEFETNVQVAAVGGWTFATIPLPAIRVGSATQAAQPQVEVVPGPGTHVAAGELARATFDVRNRGTALISLGLAGSATNGWTNPFVEAAGQPTDEIVLAAGEKAPMAVRAVTPEHAPGWTGLLGLEATTLVAPHDSATASTTTRLHGPSLEVGALSLNPEGGPYVGKPVVLRVPVTNAGDQANTASQQKTLAVHVASADGETLVTPALPPISVGNTYHVDVELPEVANVGPIRFTAQTDQSVATLDRIVGAGLIELLPPAPSYGTPGEQVPYRNAPHAFIVRNPGNRQEQVEVAISEGEGNIETQAMFTLAPGESRPIPVVHALPTTVGAARFIPITLKAWINDRDASIMAQASVSTQIVDRQAPVATWHATPPSRWLPGVPLSLLGTAVDDTELDSATLVVVNATGTWTTTLDGPPLWNFTLTLPAGIHTLRLEALDVHSNRAATENHTLEVTTSEAPEIQGLVALPTEAGAYSLQASIRSTHPLARLDLLVDGMAHPIDIGAVVVTELGLAPGNHSIELTATDVEGNVAREQLQVEVPGASEEAQDSNLPASVPGKDAPAWNPAMLVANLFALALTWRRHRR